MKKHLAYQVTLDAYEYYVTKMKPKDFKKLWIEGDHIENRKDFFDKYYSEMQSKNEKYFKRIESIT